MPEEVLSAAQESLLSPLSDLCKARDLPMDSRALSRFATYLELLLHFNQSMNLIGPMPPEDVVRELLLDSVTPLLAHTPQGPMLDIGSGAGLPGIPLKILYPELPITLIEPRKKRASFLNIAKKRLGLEEVTVFADRVEAFYTPHHYVISKAFQPPTQWLATATPLTTPGGVILCMTRQQELDALEEVAATLGLQRCGEAAPEHATRDGVADRVVYAFRRLGEAP